MLGPMDDLGRAVGIDERLFEQAQAKLLLEKTAHGAVDQAHRHLALADALDQVEHVARLIGDADVHSGRQGDRAGVLLRGRQALGDDRADATAFGEHQAVEAQFLPQDAGQQFFRGMGGHGVDGRIGGHDAQGPRFLDARFPRGQKHFSQHAFGNVHGPAHPGR